MKILPFEFINNLCLLVADDDEGDVAVGAVEDFELDGVAAVVGEVEGDFALGTACPEVACVVVPHVEPGVVGAVDLHGDEAAGLGDDGELLVPLGGKGVAGALAGLDKTGAGEDGTARSASAMCGGAVHVVGMAVDVIAGGKAVGKGFVKHEMTVEGADGVVLATQAVEVDDIALAELSC